MEIRLEQGTDEAIRRHAAEAYPDECCGAMLGRVTAGGKVVTRALRIHNARTDSARNRFLVTDRDYLRVEAQAAAEGLDLVGFYHSHPDHPARPSRFDLDHALPVFSCVIVSVAEGRPERMTSWVLSEDRLRFEPEAVRVGSPGSAGPRVPSPRLPLPPSRGARP
jgi:proteasome lid subunit RPN8/RPN11